MNLIVVKKVKHFSCFYFTCFHGYGFLLILDVTRHDLAKITATK